jgi:hypothetical protein
MPRPSYRSANPPARVSGNGIGLGGVLFVTLLVLKLTGFIDWSWWWVTAPLWVPVALFGVFFGVLFVVAVFK